jgi:hypothetical protein
VSSTRNWPCVQRGASSGRRARQSHVSGCQIRLPAPLTKLEMLDWQFTLSVQYARTSLGVKPNSDYRPYQLCPTAPWYCLANSKLAGFGQINLHDVCPFMMTWIMRSDGPFSLSLTFPFFAYSCNLSRSSVRVGCRGPRRCWAGLRRNKAGPEV